MVKAKNKMVAMFLATCMILSLFAGITFALPQKTTEVYAAETPTAMTKNGLNFYPVFDSTKPLPSGVKFYTKRDNEYNEITSSTLTMAYIFNSFTGVEDKTLYYTSSSNTPIKCFATLSITWNDLFVYSSGSHASGLQDNFTNTYLINGVTTPYFTSEGALSTTENWNYASDSIPTISGVSVNSVFDAYGEWISFTSCWSTKSNTRISANIYREHNSSWNKGSKDDEETAILLCDFGKTSDDSGNGGGSGDASTGIETNLAVGLSITLVCLTLTATYVVVSKKKKLYK